MATSNSNIQASIEAAKAAVKEIAKAHDLSDFSDDEAVPPPCIEHPNAPKIPQNIIGEDLLNLQTNTQGLAPGYLSMVLWWDATPNDLDPPIPTIPRINPLLQEQSLDSFQERGLWFDWYEKEGVKLLTLPTKKLTSLAEDAGYQDEAVPAFDEANNVDATASKPASNKAKK